MKLTNEQDMQASMELAQQLARQWNGKAHAGLVLEMTLVQRLARQCKELEARVAILKAERDALVERLDRELRRPELPPFAELTP